MGSNNGVLKLFTMPLLRSKNEVLTNENIIEKDLKAHEVNFIQQNIIKFIMKKLDDTLWVLTVDRYHSMFLSCSDMAICFWDLKTKSLIKKFPSDKTVQSLCIYENKLFAGIGGYQPKLCTFSFFLSKF